MLRLEAVPFALGRAMPPKLDSVGNKTAVVQQEYIAEYSESRDRQKGSWSETDQPPMRWVSCGTELSTAVVVA